MLDFLSKLQPPLLSIATLYYFESWCIWPLDSRHLLSHMYKLVLGHTHRRLLTLSKNGRAGWRLNFLPYSFRNFFTWHTFPPSALIFKNPHTNFCLGGIEHPIAWLRCFHFLIPPAGTVALTVVHFSIFGGTVQRLGLFRIQYFLGSRKRPYDQLNIPHFSSSSMMLHLRSEGIKRV